MKNRETETTPGVSADTILGGKVSDSSQSRKLSFYHVICLKRSNTSHLFPVSHPNRFLLIHIRLMIELLFRR